MGQIVAIVAEAKTEKAITDAKIEILTLQNALITTVTPNYFGKARHSLEEGRIASELAIHDTRLKCGRFKWSKGRPLRCIYGSAVALLSARSGGAGRERRRRSRQADLSISPTAATLAAATAPRTVPPVLASGDDV